jgi:hypothetical protein
MPENTMSITDPNHVAPVFVSVVVGSGIYNHVANITFGTLLFSPKDDVIEPDMVVSCRLRLDLICLQQLYEQIGQMLNPPSTEKPN